jgi:hypothetical protein
MTGFFLCDRQGALIGGKPGCGKALTDPVKKLALPASGRAACLCLSPGHAFSCLKRCNILYI